MALVEWVAAFCEICRRILKIFATVDLLAVRVSIGWASTRGSVTPPRSAGNVRHPEGKMSST